jgi:predicted peptidase
MYYTVILMSLGLICLIMPGCAGSPDGGPQEGGRLLDRSLNGSRFAVWLPPGFDSRQSWPLIVFLHGKGECGTDGRRQTEVGLGPALRSHPERWPFLVLLPQKPDQDSAWEDHRGMVEAQVNDVRREFGFDEQRLYLTGLSQGGHGTWAIAAMDPGAWAAIAPVCAYGDPALGVAVTGLPVWAFHGGRDDIVPPERGRVLVEAALAAGGSPEPRLTIYPEANHNSWDRAYAEEELPAWFLSWVRRTGDR